MMLVLVDIGNTTTTVGLSSSGRLERVQRVATASARNSKFEPEPEVFSNLEEAGESVLCSVVPELTSFWQKRLEEATGLPPLVVTNQIQLGMGISYPDPSSIGGDRLANAVGALTEYGSPVIVADFGTALTFDVIDPQNNYVGGAIAPGLNFMTDYLADRTALLPRITIRGECPPIGTTTEGAMRLGAIMGYSGMVERVVRHLRSQPQASGASLCLTGGSAELIGEHLEVDFVLDPELTLKGLQRIYELNADTARQPKGGC